MTAREQRVRMRLTVGRGWLRNSLPRQGECVAQVQDGNLCGKPASYFDPGRGGMVCDEHKPK